MAVLWICKGWKHCQKHWRASRETLSKLSRMKRFFETASKKNQCSCFRRFCGIMLEFQQNLLKLIQYMQATTSSLGWVKFGSSLCIRGSGKEPNTIWTPPLLHDDKNDAERWGGYRTDSVPLCLQPCGVFILRHCVGLGAARAKIGKYRLACRGAMPRSQFIPVKIHSGLRERVGHTSPSYKVCPRLPVWTCRIVLESATCRIVLDIIQSSKLYLRRRIYRHCWPHARTVRSHVRTVRSDRSQILVAKSSVLSAKSEVLSAKSMILEAILRAQCGRAVRARSVSAQCARAVRAGSVCAQCARAHSVTACS